MGGGKDPGDEQGVQHGPRVDSARQVETPCRQDGRHGKQRQDVKKVDDEDDEKATGPLKGYEACREQGDILDAKEQDDGNA